MAIKIVTPPANEPISLVEAKLHLRVDSDNTADDDLINFLITAAREYAENFTGRCLFTTEIDAFYDAFPPSEFQLGPVNYQLANVLYPSGGCIWLPRSPVQTIEFVKYYDSNNTLQTLDPSLYLLDNVSEPSRLVPTYAQKFWQFTLPIPNAVQVRLKVGYDDSNSALVPASIRQAIKMMIAAWYEFREAAVLPPRGTIQDLPPVIAADRLLWQERVWR